MVVLERMPDPGVVRALKGSVDFYVDKGRVIARSWPQKRRGRASLFESYGNHWLTQANIAYRGLHGQQQRFYRLYSRQGTFTPRDFMMKHYFGSFPHPNPAIDFGRIKRQAYAPSDPLPYFSIVGLDLTGQPDGSVEMRVRSAPGLTLVWNWLDVFPLTGSIFKANRRGITFNRCWRLHADRAMNQGAIFDTATPGDYLRNLGFIQPASGQRLIWFYFDAYIPPVNDRLRSFSHWYAINLRATGDYDDGVKYSFGIPREPNLRTQFPYHSTVGAPDLDTPFSYTVPIPNQWGLLEPFRVTDP